jgi:Uma2 family endonuclease
MSSGATLVTPEDLLQMVDEGKGYELVNGELRELDASKESSHIAGEIYNRLKNHCDRFQPSWVFPEGTSYCCFPDDDSRVRRPDTSLIRLDRMTPEQYRVRGHCEIVPDLVVEVASPNDNAEELQTKIEEWLNAGVKLQWIVHPATRHILVYRLDDSPVLFRSADTLTAPELLTGFSCPVADLFRLPGEPDPAA